RERAQLVTERDAGRGRRHGVPRTLDVVSGDINAVLTGPLVDTGMRTVRNADQRMKRPRTAVCPRVFQYVSVTVLCRIIVHGLVPAAAAIAGVSQNVEPAGQGRAR